MIVTRARLLILPLAALWPALFAGCQDAHPPASAAPLVGRASDVDNPTAPLAGRASDGQASSTTTETATPTRRASEADLAPTVEAASDSGPAVDPASPPTTPAATEPVAAEPAPAEPVPVAAAPAADAAAAPAANDEDNGKLRDITFDTIKFDMEKEDPYDRELIGPEIEALTGKSIKIRGYILPASVFKQTGITGFVLVRDNMECCFGPGAALYDCIVVQMKPGKTTDFTVRPVAVEGTFKIEELENPVEPDGNPIAIYHLDGEAVE